MSRYIDADFEIAHYTSMTTNPTPDVTEKDKRNSLVILDALRMAKTVEPKRGEWAKRTHDTLIAQVNFAYCSECGQPIMHEHTRPLWNFCPNCGADMRERKDFQVIVNGNCTICGKPLSGNRIFICEECEEQSKEGE